MKRVGSSGVQGFLAALLIHVVGIGGLFVVSPTEKSKASVRPPVKVRVADRPPPSPPPVEVKEPVVVEPGKPLRKKTAAGKKTPAASKPEPAQPEPQPAASSSAAPPPRTTAPRKFTVAMEATVPVGGVAVPASSGGGWTFGVPDGDPEADKTLAGPEPAPPEEKVPPAPREAAGVTRLPKLISQPSNLDMRAAYPEAARRENREANVYLKILVTADGQVARVRVVRGAGEGFDRAAVALVKKFRFRPAEADGQPVSVWLPWTYKFRMEK